MDLFHSISSMASRDDEPFYQITLEGPVWDTGNRNPQYFQEKIDILKTNFERMILRTTTLRDSGGDDSVAFRQNIMRHPGRTRSLGLQSHVKKDLWMADGLSYWMEFTENKLPHWCQFMNESLINLLFLGVKVFYDILNNGVWFGRGMTAGISTTPIDPQYTERLEAFLKHALDTFFKSHGTGQVNSDHLLGLQEFYRLNVNDVDGDPVTMSVPCHTYGVTFDSPAEFVDNWMRYTTEFWTQTILGDLGRADLPLISQTIRYQDGGEFQFLLGLSPLIKHSHQWGALGEMCFRNIVKLPHDIQAVNNAATNWCKMMSDELISQIYMTVSTILYVLNTFPPQNTQGRQFPTLETIRNHVLRTYNLFFRIDSRTPSNVREIMTATVAEQQLAKWSGHWGMSMLIHQNFRHITEDYYETLHDGDNPPELIGDEDPDGTESDSASIGSEGDSTYFPFNGPRMSQGEYMDRALAFASITSPKMRIDGSMSNVVNRLSSENIQQIMENVASSRRLNM